MNRRRISFISALLVFLALCLAAAAQAEVNRDVTYTAPDGVPVKMDIYLPEGASTGPRPAVMYVHGGGWMKGSKDTGTGKGMIALLVSRGYVVAAIDYRLAPQYKFPAQIEDTKCAVRYLRANAKTYNIDPMRIGAYGGSAGGHLVSLLGLTTSKDGFEGKGGYEKESSSVQAVADMFGPTDLATMGTGPRALQVGIMVFGALSLNDPAIKKASPVTYVSKKAPPFLILQGDKDKLVAPQQSQLLYDKLKAAGADVTLVMVKNAGHGFAPEGGPISPSLPEIGKTIADFFDKHLK